MFADVTHFVDFYTTPPGVLARHAIGHRIARMWPAQPDLDIAGYGYALPYLDGALRHHGRRTIALMPTEQGGLGWGRPNRVAVVEGQHWPVPDRTLDRLLMVHVIEFSQPPRPVLREAWRVLKDNGRLLVVVPNRRGIWARLDITPFGWGQPYSRGQLLRLLGDCLFVPTQVGHALFMPPSLSGRAIARAWEDMGQRWFGQFCGVILIEAVKQVLAPTRVARWRPLPVAPPRSQPVPR